jgi:hypothetical protein
MYYAAGVDKHLETDSEDRMTLVTLNQGLTRKQQIVFALGLLCVLAILAPIAYLALQTVVSTTAACIVALILWMGVMALGPLMRWWRIAVLKMLKASAQQNPVETLQLELISRTKAYEAAARTLVIVKAKRDSLREMLDDYRAKHGKADQNSAKVVDKLSTLVDRLEASLRQTGATIGTFKQFVAEQADRWDIAKATGELAVMLRATQGGDVTDVFLADTAIKTIRDGLNTSLAEIDAILQVDEVQSIVRQVSSSAGADALAADLRFELPSPERVSDGRT